jgi:hypothetical protein
MLVALILKTPLIEEKRFRQWNVVKDALQGMSGRHEMKLGLQWYAVVLQLAKDLYRT